MIPILYAAGSQTFTNNGLGGLGDCISCVVTEERNGPYTLEMVYPVDGIHFSDITYSSIIKVIPSDGASEQLFRVYKISKPINGRVAISADHISYQLSFIPVSPFTAASVSDALDGLESHSMETNPFSLWTDKTTSGTYQLKVPASLRSQLGGVSGSILDVYGGEYEWDNYTVKLHASRGADRGVTLRYGKNITDIKQEENIANTITGICPYWTDGEGNTVYGSIQYSSNAGNYPYKRSVVKDFSSDFESQPTTAQLEAKAQSYIANNNIGVPSINITVSFAALWQSEEYKDVANLERVKLCDTMTIIFEKLEIQAQAKVIKTEYDVLKERYRKIELGEARSTLAKTITNIEQEVEKGKDAVDVSMMNAAIAHGTQLIVGGLGGYVYLKPNANGQPEEILIMDNPDYTQAVNIIRMNKNGIGYSNTGYNGTYKTAWTIDGAFTADVITTGTMRANRIRGGTLALGGSGNGNGVLKIYDSNGSEIGTWNNGGINLNGNFVVGTDGKITATGANISGKVSSGGLSSVGSDGWIRMQGSVIDGGPGTTVGNDRSYINFNNIIEGTSRVLQLRGNAVALSINKLLVTAQEGATGVGTGFTGTLKAVNVIGSSGYSWNNLQFVNGILVGTGYT